MTLPLDPGDRAPGAATKAPAPLFVFAYGTLKRGYWNHALLARGFVSVEEATVPGILREFPNGIPILDLPARLVLAKGTPNLLADAALSGADRARPAEEAPEPRVEGEMFAYDDPERRLAALDDLEEYDAATGAGRYVRVLATVRPKGRANDVDAWVYAGADIEALLPIGSRWPPPRRLERA